MIDIESMFHILLNFKYMGKVSASESEVKMFWNTCSNMIYKVIHRDTAHQVSVWYMSENMKQ
jgi:hypothetical protein